MALLAPVLGQNSDRSGRTVRNLRLQTWLLAGLSASLYVVQPGARRSCGSGSVLLGVGSVVSEIAGVNYNATIDQVATVEDGGAGVGLRLGDGLPRAASSSCSLLYFLLIQPDVGLFGVTDADGMDIRVSMLHVRAVDARLHRSPRSSCCATRAPAEGAARGGRRCRTGSCGASIRGLWGTSRHTVYFLLASALFRDGLAGVFAFGADPRPGTFGLSAGDVIVFGAAANIVAGFATMGFGLLDDRIGPEAGHPHLAGVARRARGR